MQENERLELTYKVTEQDLAKALPISAEDDFPAVLATSRMIALMELAAARLMKSLLNDGELSVGVKVDVTHMAATPNAEEVKAVAIYRGREAKLYRFEVELHDRGGLAGRGIHTRAIVSTERLLQGAQDRMGS